MFEEFLLIMIFIWPAFMLPAILGSLILVQFGHDPLGRMVGAFTLKPLVATPLWALIFAFGSAQNLPFTTTQVFSWIPGVALTLLLLLIFRNQFGTNKRIAFFLLAADVLRWLNSFIGVALNRSLGGTIYNFYIAAIVIANLYAVIAWFVLWLRARNQEALSG